MNLDYQVNSVKNHYNNKSNIQGFILFAMCFVISFLLLYRVITNIGNFENEHMFFWELFGFSNDFAWGFMASLIYIGGFISISQYVYNKRKWMSVLIIDNMNNPERVYEIENKLLKLNMRTERIMLNPEAHKYPYLIKKALTGCHWILVVNDGRPISEDNKKYIQYAHKKKIIIKWYRKSEFKFKKPTITKLDLLWGWYLGFFMFASPIIILSIIFPDSFVNNQIFATIFMVLFIVVPIFTAKWMITWFRKKTRVFDVRYMNMKELKKMGSM